MNLLYCNILKIGKPIHLNRWYISMGTISKVHLISNKTCYNKIAQIGFISSLRDTGPVA